MKKLLAIMGVISIAAPVTTNSVSCQWPYRHISTFEKKIKDGDTFIIYYHVSGDDGSISFEQDRKFVKANEDSSYMEQKIQNTYNEYSNIVDNGTYDASDENYFLNGFGYKSSNDTIEIEDWSVDSSSDIWQEIWSRKIWSWIRMSLTETYYYKTIESQDNNIDKPITYENAETYVGNYLSNASLNSSSSPIFIVIRGGKFVGFNTYHTSSDTPGDDAKVKDFSTPQNRIDDFSDSLNKLFTDQDLSSTLVQDINSNQSSS